MARLSSPEWWKREAQRVQVDLDRAAVDELAAELRARGVRSSKTVAWSEIARAQADIAEALTPPPGEGLPAAELLAIIADIERQH